MSHRKVHVNLQTVTPDGGDRVGTETLGACLWWHVEAEGRGRPVLEAGTGGLHGGWKVE